MNFSIEFFGQEDWENWKPGVWKLAKSHPRTSESTLSRRSCAWYSPVVSELWDNSDTTGEYQAIYERERYREYNNLY